MSGYVYCLTVPRMPGVVKIGYTAGSVEKRVKDLDNTSVVEPLQLYYAGRVRNPITVEKKIHEIYKEQRIRPNREFFDADPEQVKRIIQLAEVASQFDSAEDTPLKETEEKDIEQNKEVEKEILQEELDDPTAEPYLPTYKTGGLPDPVNDAFEKYKYKVKASSSSKKKSASSSDK